MKRCLLSADCQRPAPVNSSARSTAVTILLIVIAIIAGVYLLRGEKKVEYTAEDYNAWLTELNTWLVKQPGAPRATFTGEQPGRVITIRIMGSLPAELVMDSDKHAALAAGLAKTAADEYLKQFEADLSVEVTVEEQLSGGGMWMETFHDIVLRSEWEKQGGGG